MTYKPEPTDWFFHEKPESEKYKQCWVLHSIDGFSPELDYNELIFTIVSLYDKIADLERRLDKQEEYQ